MSKCISGKFQDLDLIWQFLSFTNPAYLSRPLTLPLPIGLRSLRELRFKIKRKLHLMKNRPSLSKKNSWPVKNSVLRKGIGKQSKLLHT